MTSANWFAFLMIGLLTAFSPGPAVALAVAKALGAGPRIAAVSSAGNVAGVLAAGAISVAVLNGIAGAWNLMQPIRVVGGVYLIILGLRSTLASPPRHENVIRTGSSIPSGAMANFASGAGVALLNPKSYVFFGVMTPGVSMGQLAIVDGALQVACFAACTALSHAVYILACAHAPLTTGAATMVSKACGAATALLGVSFLAAALGVSTS